MSLRIYAWACAAAFIYEDMFYVERITWNVSGAEIYTFKGINVDLHSMQWNQAFPQILLVNTWRKWS